LLDNLMNDTVNELSITEEEIVSYLETI